MVDAEANEGGQECSDSALYSAEYSRRLLLSLACLQSACSTGVLFGFSGMACDAFSPGGVGARGTARIYHAHTALAAALLEKGEYSELCAGAEAEAQLAADGACTAQTLRFSLIYTFASTCLFSAFLVFGLIVDRFGGPLRANLAGTGLVALGLLVLSQSNSKTLDLFPLGFALIGDACPVSIAPALRWSLSDCRTEIALPHRAGLGGPGVHISLFHVALLFPAERCVRPPHTSRSHAFSLAAYRALSLCSHVPCARVCRKNTIQSLIVGAFVWSGIAFPVERWLIQDLGQSRAQILAAHGVPLPALLLCPSRQPCPPPTRFYLRHVLSRCVCVRAGMHTHTHAFTHQHTYR